MHKFPDRTDFAAEPARFRRNGSRARRNGGGPRLENQRRDGFSRRQAEAEFGDGNGEEYRGKTKKPNQHHVSAEFGYEYLSKVAARPGLEPRLNEPESLVLPLHQRAVNEILI